MKIDNNTADDLVVARIEISDYTNDTILASREITRKEFMTADSYQDFYLNFNYPNTTDTIESRVYYKKNALITVDKAKITDEKTISNKTYEAETDMLSIIRTKDSSGKYGKYGIEATVNDQAGVLAYGPYVDRLALGTYSVDYYLKVDNNNNDSNQVLRLDIYDSTKRQIIAEKTIKRTDFDEANKTQVFSLKFNSLDFVMNEKMLGHKIETRITAKGKSKITLDKTTISNDIDGSVKLNIKNKSSAVIDASQLNTTSRTVLMRGIDVSHPGQPEHIDWATVSNNVDFAIIRAGYGNSAAQMDDTFIENYNGATKNGVLVGAYWYSYAESVEDAIAEAKACIQVLGDRLFQFPIYYDIEENVTLSKGTNVCSAIAKAFCDTIKEAGYTAGIYTSLSVLNSGILDYNTQQAYALWVAQWNPSFDYKSPAGMWQYSETGSVAGISHAVDLDACYVNYPAIL